VSCVQPGRTKLTTNTCSRGVGCRIRDLNAPSSFQLLR
jgi:hypothetical protein